tara:strand:+ start:228 stop:428 length:201 start_codon:yes stop_codon:yes gene_type:complete
MIEPNQFIEKFKNKLSSLSHEVQDTNEINIIKKDETKENKKIQSYLKYTCSMSLCDYDSPFSNSKN